MKTYLLFIFGSFQDHDDVEFFCTEIFNQSEAIISPKYVIENLNSVIMIFDSEYDYTKLSNEIHTLLNNENIEYYFLFEKEGLVSAHLPKTYNDFIFKFKSIKNEEPEKLELDELLDKIQKSGMDSLTSEEKKFLDNFDF
jgi:hypothetical protein